MCDFVSSEGADIIQQESNYTSDKNLLLNFVKGNRYFIKIGYRAESTIKTKAKTKISLLRN